MEDLEFVVLDTETTGLSPFKGARLTEIAGVLIKNWHIEEERYYEELIYPECEIPYFITRLTGITNDMVKGKRTFREVLPCFDSFIKGKILVIQNAHFDLRFLDFLYPEAGLELLNNPFIDTIHISKNIFTGRHNLDTILKRLNISIESSVRHRALGDVMATAKAFLSMVGMIGVSKVSDFINYRY